MEHRQCVKSEDSVVVKECDNCDTVLKKINNLTVRFNYYRLFYSFSLRIHGHFSTSLSYSISLSQINY